MPKKETKSLLVGLILINIASIGAFVLLFNYTNNLITESVEKGNEIKTELKIEDTRALMKEDLDIGAMYKGKIMDYLIPSGGTVEFIKTIEQLVSNSDVKADIKSVSTENYEKGSTIGIELLKINMDIIGEWKNVRLFINTLENYPLKVDIRKVSLNKFSENTVKGKVVPQWSANFEFTVVKIKDIK